MQACKSLIDETPEEQYRIGSPCLVEALKNHTVFQVSCGRDFTLAIAAPPRNGPEELMPAQVYGWGNNKNGQLGVEFNGDQTNFPVRIEAFDVLDEEIMQISCGFSHSLFLTSDQDVISCGNNYHGQCGFDPDECVQTSTPFKVAAFDGIGVSQVSAGFQHSLFLTADGEVFSSGSNSEMQLGTGVEPLKTITPI